MPRSNYDLDDELLFLQLYEEEARAAREARFNTDDDPYDDVSALYESDSGGVREPYSEENDTGWYR